MATAMGLCVVGALLVLVAAGRPWVSVEVPASLLVDARTDSHTGTDLSAVVRALGLVGLAAAVALAATRRTLVGWLLLATGVGVVAAVLDAIGAALAETLPGQRGDSVAHLSGWLLLTAVGGVLLFAAGAQAVPADPS